MSGVTKDGLDAMEKATKYFNEGGGMITQIGLNTLNRVYETTAKGGELIELIVTDGFRGAAELIAKNKTDLIKAQTEMIKAQKGKDK